LQKLSPTNSALISRNDYSVSIYNGELTTQGIIEQVKKLKKAFPALPAGFYDVLTDRIKELKISDARLTDAVNHVIDTCMYPTPTIANIISWDVKIKLLTYDDMIDMVQHSGPVVWDNYKAVEPPRDVPVRVYAHVNDIERFNLTTLK